MILSGHQPTYLPGTILFNKIALSDYFMFVGHCQYVAKSWHTHNFIRTGKLSIPVHKGPSINETTIAGDYWRDKHLKSIKLAYQSYPYFHDYFPELQAALCQVEDSLGQFNMDLVNLILEWLEIDTIVLNGDAYNITEHKTDMLIQMCGFVGADEYLSSPGETYVDREKMALAGIKHHFQEFHDPDYGQKRLVINGKEQPLSIIDLIFSVGGPKAGRIVRGAGIVCSKGPLGRNWNKT